MAKKSREYIINAATLAANSVKDSRSYQNFLNQMKLLFDNNNITVEEREKIKNAVVKTFNKNNYKIDNQQINDFFNDLSIARLVDYTTVDAEKVNGIKNFLNKKRVTAGAIILGAGIVGITTFGRPKFAEKNTSNVTVISNETPSAISNNNEINQSVNTTINNDETNPLLHFDPQDKQVLINKIYSLFKDSIPKGHKVTKKNIAQEVANWTDAYMVANIENIGPDFLLKYLQNDSKDSLSMIENYLRVVSQVNSDALVSENSWNLNSLFANKSDADLVAKFQKLVREIVKNTKAKDKNKVKETSVQLRKELEKLVRSNGSRQYSNAAIVMAINLSFSGANVAKINGMANVVIPEDLRGVVYTDGAVKCIEAIKEGKGTLKENIKKIGGQDNVYMKAILGLYEETEKDIDQMITLYSSMTEEDKAAKFTNEISYNNSQNTLIKKIKGILNTYKADKSYAELYYKNFKVSSKVRTITKTTIVKSSTAKTIAKKKKAGKKITVKDIASKDFIKGKIKGKSGKTVTTKSKNEHILIEEATKQGYSAGYNKGMTLGSLGKAKSIGVVSVPSKFAKNAKAAAMYKSQYRSGFNKGYSDGYKVYKENRDYKKVVVTGTKTTESKVKNEGNVKSSNSDSSSSSSSNTSSSSSSSSNSDSSSSSSSNSEKVEVEESEVYDIEDVSQETKSVKINESTSQKIQSLQRIKERIQGLSVETVDEYSRQK